MFLAQSYHPQQLLRLKKRSRQDEHLLQQQRVGPGPLAEASMNQIAVYVECLKPTVVENVAEVSTRFNGAK